MATPLTIDMIPRVGHQWRYPTKFIITQNLTDPSYLIDGYDGDKFDFTLNGDVDLELENIKEGVEYKFILTVDRANAAIQRPVSIFFSSLEDYCIAWKGVLDSTPKIYDNGEIILYRSGNTIYGTFKDEYIGNGNESDDCVFGEVRSVYTPTLENVTNISASTAFECAYFRVGNVVHVSGRADFDHASPGLVELGISLPIPSEFTATSDLSGVGVGNNNNDVPMFVVADVANNRALLSADISSNTDHPHYFMFSYKVKN